MSSHKRLQRDATFRAALVNQAEDIVQANAQKGAAGIDASAALASQTNSTAGTTCRPPSIASQPDRVVPFAEASARWTASIAATGKA